MERVNLYKPMKKSCCLLTYVHDEHFFFPIFLKYYTKIFNPEDIFVVENNCENSFIYNYRKKFLFNNFVFNTKFNHDFTAINQELTRLMRILLDQYYSVYLAECDEILYHPNGLIQAAKKYFKWPQKVIRCLGYEPIHDIQNNESALNPDLSLLKQRKLWWDNNYFRKPVFIKEPIDYWNNMHNFDEAYPTIDTQLMLIHLKMIDYDVLYARNQKTLLEGNFHPETLTLKKGWQNRIEKKEQFDSFFTENVCKCVPIPEKYKIIC